MAAPRALENQYTYVTIDGIDMHLYGMVVHKVINPIPSPVESSVSIPGRDGAFDYSKSLGSRLITVEGEIIADSHYNLLQYVDAINKIIRLRSDGSTYMLQFTDQPDRYWMVRISYCDLQYKGLSGFGKSMRFSMRFLSPKPFAEHISMYTFFTRLSINKTFAVNVQGNYKVPANMHFKKIEEHNLIEDAASYNATYRCAWQANDNCSLSYSGTNVVYGSYGTVVTRTNVSLASTVNIDLVGTGVGQLLDGTKALIISTYLKATSGIGTVTLRLTAGSKVFTSQAIFTTVWELLTLTVEQEDIDGETDYDLFVDCSADSTFTSFVVHATSLHTIDSRYDASATGMVPIPYSIGVLPVDDLSIKVFNSENIFSYKNGQETINWIDGFGLLGVTKNPIDNDNCLCFQADALLTPAQYSNSQVVYVQQGLYYRISLKHFVREFEGNAFYVFVYWRHEKAGNIKTDILATINATGNSFATAEGTFAAPSGATYLQISLHASSANVVAYIKDIMVAYQPLETPPTYKDPAYFAQEYSGNIAVGDSLSIDNENMYCRLEDKSEKTVINAMGDFSGDQILLEPGYNYISMSDARKESINPETESAGTLGLTLSYRPRFI